MLLFVKSSVAWQKELATTHVPETVEYGVTSLVIRAARPFHPARLAALIAGCDHMPWQSRDVLRGVVRVKG